MEGAFRLFAVLSGSLLLVAAENVVNLPPSFHIAVRVNDQKVYADPDQITIKVGDVVTVSPDRLITGYTHELRNRGTVRTRYDRDLKIYTLTWETDNDSARDPGQAPPYAIRAYTGKRDGDIEYVQERSFKIIVIGPPPSTSEDLATVAHRRIVVDVRVDFALLGGDPVPAGAWKVPNRLLEDHFRAQAREKCVATGGDPNNIGLPFYSREVRKFSKDERGYRGAMTFDCNRPMH